ncbi:MAG: NYN domain-containing protein [Cellulomonadaceae bacterium]|jgi:hypothetical protein|nr:NYN domain-containing protein [Cellulomonadaceae bacterium]
MERGNATSRLRANVYVDGLNLYGRLLKGHPEIKWLDVAALAERLLPECDVLSINYFTAIIKALPGSDPQSPQRQQAYLRALSTDPRIRVFLGKFRVDRRLMHRHPTEFSADGTPMMSWVKKAEEKGSDVNLASRILVDAAHGVADVYAVCTNDSDLVMPLNLVREEFGGRVCLISPTQLRRASNELKRTRPLWHRSIGPTDLAACQLPAVLTDEVGLIVRPSAWKFQGPRRSEAL